MFSTKLLEEFEDIPKKYKPKYKNCKNACILGKYTPDWEDDIKLRYLYKFHEYKKLISKSCDLWHNSSGKKEYELYKLYRFWTLSKQIDKTKYLKKRLEIKKRSIINKNAKYKHLKKGYFAIGNFIDYKMENGVQYVLVKWKGYPSIYNSWEPVQSLYKDVPNLVKIFLNNYFSNKERNTRLSVQ